MKLTQATAIALAIYTTNIWAADATSSPVDKSSTELLSLGTALAKADVATLEQKAINAAAGELQSATKSYLEKLFPTVELSLGLGDPSKPTAGLLVVAPLSDPKDVKNTFFTQGSVYHFDNRTTVNLGLGYRRLEWDNKLLLGVNGFYDHEFPYDHGRTSIGLEARTTVGEINFNQYWGVTGWRTAKNNFEERALGGTDLEIGVPLPYMPWAKVYARTFVWDAKDDLDNLKGTDLSLRAQLPILPGLAIEGGHRAYNSYPNEDFLRITYNVMDFNAKKPTQPFFSENAYQLSSMEDRRYEKVRRENLIVKQKRAKGFSVKIVKY